MDYVKKNKALRVLKNLSILQFCLVILVMILGGVCNGQHGQPADGVPPYYIGVFIIAPLALLTSVVGLVIYFRGRHCFSKNVAEQKIGCLMRTYCILLPFNWLGCLVAVLIAGFSGICTSSKCSYIEHSGRNYRLAVTIVIFLMMIFVTDVIGLVILCIHSSNFGIVLFLRGKNRISNMIPESSPPSVYATTEHAMANFQIQNQIHPQCNHIDTTTILGSNQRQQPIHNNSNRLQPNHRIPHTDDQTPRLSNIEPKSEFYHQIRSKMQDPSDVKQPDSRHQQRTSQNSKHQNSDMQETNIHEQSPRRAWQAEQDDNESTPSPVTQIIITRRPARRAQNQGNRHNNRNGSQPPTHRKKKKRRNVRPSHPTAVSQGQGFVLPPIASHIVPPPPASPPPPPNTPPPPFITTNRFDDDSSVLPPISSRGITLAPPSPPPPPNTPPPALSNTNSFNDNPSPPPTYHINEYLNDPPPPYIP